jgi:hypothetical protein
MPNIKPLVVVDAPAGMKATFYKVKKAPSHLIPPECVRDMQMSSVAMCKLGPAQSTLAQNGPCTPGDETPVLDMVKESAASAIENGAGAVSATVEFATPLFLVPTRLVNEEFEVADLTSMIAAGAARCVFAGEMEPRLREAAGLALTETGFEQRSRSYTIEGTFEDDNVALFKVGENDEVLPDEERAVEKGAIDPKFVSGEDLAERAKLCTISKTNNGRLNLPLVRSSDLRVCGPKIMAFQTTIMSELYLQAEDGWAAEVAGCKTFDHAETQAAPDASYSAMTFSRKHLRPDTEQLDSADAEYPVSAVMFLSLGSLASFKIVINEVPPPDDEGSVIEYTPDEAAATTAAIVTVARSVVTKMPLYTPAAPTAGGVDLSNMSPADQARELARQQREQIKASLASTMGGGKFELTRRDGPRE